MIPLLDWDELERTLGTAMVSTAASRTGAWRRGTGQRPDDAVLERDVVWRAIRLLDLFNGTSKIASTGEWAAGMACVWSGHGPTRPDTGAEYVPANGGRRGWYFCFHHQDRTMEDFYATLSELLREDSGGAVSCLAALDFDDVDPATVGVPSMNWAWKTDWQRGGKDGDGAPTANVFNVMLALREAPELRGTFGFNQFTLHEMLHQELPGVIPGTTPGVPRAWRDQDTVLLQCWLQSQGLRTVTAWMVDAGVNAVMHEQAYHPVRDWLESLSWDGVSRLETWLARYLGTPQNPYHAHVGRWFLMTMCRRVFEPGCRADYVLVLEGPQGIEKSTLLARLAGTLWFSDNLPDIGTKDASEHLVGRWLVEIAEMDKFDRAESAAMKAFISRTTERYRRAYAKRTGDEPRQCVFAGTVNHRSYLKDETGNRRYWPIAVGGIDLAGLALVRDQLFAEAWHHAVTLGEPYWPDTMFEDLFIQPEQDARLEADLWEPMVESFLRNQSRVLVHEVVVACVGGGSFHLSTANRNRVIRIMESLGWKRGPRGNGGQRFWFPA
jgi:predicted P-loop ATPase